MQIQIRVGIVVGYSSTKKFEINKNIWLNCFRFQKPVVLTDTGLVATAFGWDLDFLRINLGDGLFSVYFSDTDKFRYFDEKKRKEFGDDFLVGLERRDMKFPEFVELIRNWKEGDKRSVSTYLS